MIQRTDLTKGVRLKSTQSRDHGRTVEIIRVPDSTYYGSYAVCNVITGRVTYLNIETIRKNWSLVKSGPVFEKPTSEPAPIRSTVAKVVAAKARPLSTERERELLRIIKKCFSNYNQRGQHFYLGGGMSTSHIVLKVLEDVKQIHAFWPPEHTKRRFGSVSYVLADDVFKKVQNRIRETLNALSAKGHLEKIGNTDERRWKPTYAEVA